MNADDKLLVQFCPCIHPRCMCEGSCPENLSLDDFCPACSHPVHEHGNLKKLSPQQRTELLQHASALRKANFNILDGTFEVLMERANRVARIRDILHQSAQSSVFVDYPPLPQKEPPHDLPTLTEVFRAFPYVYSFPNTDINLPRLFRALSSILNDFPLPLTLPPSNAIPKDEWDSVTRSWISWKYKGFALVDCFGPRFFVATYNELHSWITDYLRKKSLKATDAYLLRLLEVLHLEFNQLSLSPLIDPDVFTPGYMTPRVIDPPPGVEPPSEPLVSRKRTSHVLEEVTPMKKKFKEEGVDVSIKQEEPVVHIPGIYQPSSEHDTDPPISIRRAFVSRDEKAKELEDKGLLSFRCITNDGQEKTLADLYRYCSIIFEMLPNMPKEYIVRLVFDQGHQVLLCEQTEIGINTRETKIIGGVCFKTHEPVQLVEIVFLAITEPIRKAGYGTRLMNHMKHWSITRSFDFILTYADDSAIGYFQKQGFSKNITRPREKYGGFIKDYNGATLMECILYPQFDWLNIPSMHQAQMKEINRRMIEFKVPQRIRFPPKKCVSTDITGLKRTRRAIFGIRNSNRRPLISNVSNPVYCTPVYPHFDEIPLLNGSDISPEYGDIVNLKLTAPDDVAYLHEKCNQIFEELRVFNETKCESVFSVAVPDHFLPHYYDSIRNPVDLKLIRIRLDSGNYYRTPYMFWADVQRMCDNAVAFNGKNPYGKIAQSMLQKGKKLIGDTFSHLGFSIPDS
ncbi:hypothetical protein RCL1_004428 [Eukaryota sp. TZLM3-RCL]